MAAPGFRLVADQCILTGRSRLSTEATMNPPTLIRSIGEYKEWLIDNLPKQGQWTEKEYLWLTDSTKRLVELTDGRIEVLPMPTDKHQAISYFLLQAFCA